MLEIGKREKLITILVSIILIFGFTQISYNDLEGQVGDTALYSQIVENISKNGQAVSSIHASTQDFIDRGIAAIPIDERINDPVYTTPQAEQSRNILSFHFYLILYSIAPFAKVLSAEFVVTVIQTLSFIGLLMFAYLLMRNRSTPIIGSVIALILIASHPGWSLAIFGPFYPDRIFLLTGMYLTWSISKKHFNIIHFIVAAILCMLVGERAALYAGMFVLAYTLLFWKTNTTCRTVRIVTGIVALIYSIILTKLVLSNLYYDSIFSLDLKTIISMFADPVYCQKVVLFLIINIVLFGIVSIFEWRAAIIGFLSMVPNIITNIGGAEKLGWSLHYHSYYFTILVWALAMGYSAFFIKFGDKKTKIISLRKVSYAVMGCIITLMILLDPYSFNNIILKPINAKNNITLRTGKKVSDLYVAGLAESIREWKNTIKTAVPEGSKVTAIESWMPSLSDNRTIYLYPMGIAIADYAVISYSKVDDEPVYGGAITYFGAAETQRLNDAMIEKMKNEYGYDFEHAVYIEPISAVIIPRIK